MIGTRGVIAGKEGTSLVVVEISKFGAVVSSFSEVVIAVADNASKP